jgi:hypothetical protein
MSKNSKEVAMRWKAITVGAVLGAALIATTVQQGSYGFARGGVVTDHAADSQHQILSAPPAADRVVTNDPPETEPWGPFRTTDW